MSALGEREHGEGLVASHVRVTNRSGDVIVNDVSVNARAGRTLVIVGESGGGKVNARPHAVRADALGSPR